MECSWTAFADDFKVGVAYCRDSGDSMGEGRDKLQRDLSSIATVAKSWNLIFNPDKCVIIRFGERKLVREEVYFIEGKRLKFVETHKDLGIVVDSGLRFHGHVGSVVGKVGGIMGDLLRSTICRSKVFMVSLFVSHIRPVIDYGSCLWNVGYLRDVRRLESLQRRWTREIEGLGGLSYVSRLKEVGLYSVCGRLLRLDVVKIWKSFYSDVGLSEVFEMARSVGTRGHSLKMSVPVCRSEIRRRTFAVRRVLLWNSLPADVVETTSLSTFKRRLDQFLGERLYETVDGR